MTPSKVTGTILVRPLPPLPGRVQGGAEYPDRDAHIIQRINVLLQHEGICLLTAKESMTQGTVQISVRDCRERPAF